MKNHDHHSAPSTSAGPRGGSTDSTLVEDILLLLFQPSSGSIAGENTLFYILGGASLTELALRDLVQTTTDGTDRITSRATPPPEEVLLRPAWEYLARRSRYPQTVIAAVGPNLRSQVMETLLLKGHLHQTRTTFLGFVPRNRIELGSSRREELLSHVRAVLVDEAAADARTAALIALLSASAQLHQLDPDIPWTSAVIQRARGYESGHHSAQAAGLGVSQSTFLIISALAAAAAAAPRSS
ncbi:hypothetical protein GCM10023160_22350 [Brachybacterium paraconglomeratum]|uniref:GOLPH3/VPS74 family protein n=1 Tax=Brachybacterium paraconglomeratum TaxID=173362 RepID=UPI0031F0701A